jgi:hypothetical protein
MMSVSSLYLAVLGKNRIGMVYPIGPSFEYAAAYAAVSAFPVL